MLLRQVKPRPIIRLLTDCGGLCDLTATPTATPQSPLNLPPFEPTHINEPRVTHFG